MKRFEEVHKESTGFTERIVVRDTETGIHYLQTTRGGGASVTVLYDMDGKPMRR